MNTKDTLLEIGGQMARRTGLRGLTVRGLCHEADVNPGSFVYHFGSRDNFLAELIERWYAPLLEHIRYEFEQACPPAERLRRMLLQLVQYVAEHGSVIGQVVMDGFAGEPVVIAFLRGLSMRHPQLILKCIAEAQAKGELAEGAPEHIMMYLMAAACVPVVMRGLIQDENVLPAIIQDSLNRFAADPEAIELRLEWALKGLRP